MVWQQCSAPPQLSAPAVHVWKASLNQSPATIQHFSRQLAADEAARAARFHFQQGRDHYIVARGLLRALLSRYLAVSPTSVSLAYSAHGKPSLDAAHASDLSFNLTHSGSTVLFAFARDTRVGVDIEKFRPDFEGLRIADRFFAPRESTYLRAQPEPRRAEAFIRQWTRKESFIKGRGEGLSYPLNAFHVLEGPGENTLRLSIADDPAEAARWTILDLYPEDEYAAALAVACDKPNVALFTCDVETLASE